MIIFSTNEQTKILMSEISGYSFANIFVEINIVEFLVPSYGTEPINIVLYMKSYWDSERDILLVKLLE